jgi:hypothetical protein
MNYAGQFVPGATVTLYTGPAHAATGTVATSDAQGARCVPSHIVNRHLLPGRWGEEEEKP